MSTPLLVLYYFQGEPGDSMDMPNAFLFPVKQSASAITFEVFCRHFPLHNDGSYHFRFQAEDPNHEFVWVDIQQPSQTVPLFRSNIMVKILRLNEVFVLKRRTLLRKKIAAPSRQQVVVDGTDDASTKRDYGSINRTVESPRTTNAKSVRATPDDAPSMNDDTLRSELNNVNVSDENFLDFDGPTVAPSTAPEKRSQQAVISEEHASGPIDMVIDPVHTIAPAELNREELRANLDNKINEQVRKALDDKLEVRTSRVHGSDALLTSCI